MSNANFIILFFQMLTLTYVFFQYLIKVLELFSVSCIDGQDQVQDQDQVQYQYQVQTRTRTNQSRTFHTVTYDCNLASLFQLSLPTVKHIQIQLCLNCETNIEKIKQIKNWLPAKLTKQHGLQFFIEFGATVNFNIPRA